MKYKPQDIKILHEGQQAKRLILNGYASFDEFIKKNELLLSEASIDTYTRKKKLVSEKFRVMLTRVFDKGYDELILNEQQQIARFLDDINKNINEYTDVNDGETIEKLINLCLEKRLRIELAKAYWCYGQYFYYREQISEAVDLFGQAFNILNQNKNYNLLFEYYSRLGLHFWNANDGKKSKYWLDKAEGILCKTDNLERKVLSLHYYRYGVYYNCLEVGDHVFAREMFGKALGYATDIYDNGYALMNIGISYKRQGEYDKALEFYMKALDVFAVNNEPKPKSVIINNIAEIYKLTGEYDKALEHIENAISLLGEGISKDKFIAVHTYVEINILKGEKKKGIAELLELLSKIEIVYNYTFYKKFILDGIKTILTYGISNEDMPLLEELKSILIKLVRHTAHKEYKKELKDCLCDIFLYERGELIEEEIS